MFRKILIAAMFCCAVGYCFAATETAMPQIVTSEVFYTQDKTIDESKYVEEVNQDAAVVVVPAWPIAGTDADVEVGCNDGMCAQDKQSDNIRIVSKIGADLVVENNFNMGVRGDLVVGLVVQTCCMVTKFLLALMMNVTAVRKCRYCIARF